MRQGYILSNPTATGPHGESNPWGYLAILPADGCCAGWTAYRDRAHVFSSRRAAQAAAASWAANCGITIEKVAAVVYNGELRVKLPAGTPYMRGSCIVTEQRLDRAEAKEQAIAWLRTVRRECSLTELLEHIKAQWVATETEQVDLMNEIYRHTLSGHIR